ncbi:MAG: alpha/beta hydrolase [Asgard group archaeon]|nr:alpha/beta hydrolase [Asgard group archaeon]
MINLRRYGIITIIALILTVGTLSSFAGLDWQTTKGEVVKFYSHENEVLYGKYYPGSINAGIVLLEGFGSDQYALKNVLSELIGLGLHIFTFDFTGQGRSSGVVGFDNAESIRMSLQVIIAKNLFKQLSGLTDSQIMYLGHSMGARMALQATTIDSSKLAGLVLIGTQINLEANLQSSFFTGVNDTELTWVQNLSPDNPKIDVLLLSGMWDDILKPSSAYLLYEKLSGEQATDRFAETTTASGNIRELAIYKAMFHNYEVYSPRILKKAKNWIADKFNIIPEKSLTAAKSIARIIIWISGLTSLFLAIIYGTKWLNEKQMDYKEIQPEDSVEKIKALNIDKLLITNPKKFLWMKILLLLLGSLPIAMLLIALFMLIPVGLPIFNVIYVGIFGGFGLLLVILYRVGRVPTVSEQWKPQWRTAVKQLHWKDLIFVSLTFGFILLYVTVFARSGFFNIYPLNLRLVWLAIFTILSIPGFYIGHLEKRISKKSVLKFHRFTWLNTLIILIPFFLQAIFFAILGSLSGFIGAIHGLIILAIVFLSGDLLQKISKNALITAFLQSFLLQLLVLPQGSLFRIFY